MQDERPSTADMRVPLRNVAWNKSSDMRLSTSRMETIPPRSTIPNLRRALSSRPVMSNTCVQVREESKAPATSDIPIGLIDPFKMHPPGLMGSGSLPTSRLQVQDFRPRTSCGVEAKGKQADVSGADKVNAKVSAMLAATGALKPVPALAPDLAGSKLTRLVTKVSDAFDKVHPRQRDTVDGIDAINHRLSFPSLTKPHVETIHIRLNESDNLNRKKVQKMLGSQIARKPVMDDGRSLRSKKSAENPPVETVGFPALSTIDGSATYDTNTWIPLRVNPFEGEEGFDDDLEFRILRMTPEGSSTPRIVSPPLSMMSCSLARKAMVTPNMPNFEDTSLQELDLFLSTESPEKLGRKRLAAPESFEHHVAQESPDDCKRVKKHPSPDKQYLESLEDALQKYNNLKMSGADDDQLDELAENFSRPPLRSLAPRDSNRLMTGGNHPRNMYRSSAVQEPTSQVTLFPRRHLRSTKARESQPTPSQEICLLSRLRPKGAGADDSDELL